MEWIGDEWQVFTLYSGAVLVVEKSRWGRGELLTYNFIPSGLELVSKDSSEMFHHENMPI